MSIKFEREDRYYVFKISDIEATGMSDIFPLLDTVKMITDLNRESRNKKKLDCVVVESDWPEYEPVWKSIENRTTRNAKSEDVAFAWRRKGTDDEWKVCFDMKQIPDNGIIDQLDTEFRFMRWSDLKA